MNQSQLFRLSKKDEKKNKMFRNKTKKKQKKMARTKNMTQHPRTGEKRLATKAARSTPSRGVRLKLPVRRVRLKLPVRRMRLKLSLRSRCPKGTNKLCIKSICSKKLAMERRERRRARS